MTRGDATAFATHGLYLAGYPLDRRAALQQRQHLGPLLGVYERRLLTYATALRTARRGAFRAVQDGISATHARSSS